LALTEELRGRASEAQALYEKARELQKGSARAFPVTHFITLWRLAGLADRAGHRPEARLLLGEAAGVVEAARLRTYGDARERANYFAQFEPGFDRLVEWSLRDGDIEAALVATARGRSRTLHDQLQLAGVDPRTTLKDEHGLALKKREEELRRR